jgi:hypothetical protein
MIRTNQGIAAFVSGMVLLHNKDIAAQIAMGCHCCHADRGCPSLTPKDVLRLSSSHFLFLKHFVTYCLSVQVVPEQQLWLGMHS